MKSRNQREGKYILRHYLKPEKYISRKQWKREYGKYKAPCNCAACSSIV